MLTTRTYPIALACGFSRFDELLPWRRFDRAGNDAFHYFKKIRGTVIAAGYPAFHTHVSWGAPLEKRGHDLAHEVDSILAITGAPRLHIIAHSMGGLDARYVINVLGYAAKVCSLTTIATPHHGSPLADWITDENTWRGRTLRQLQRIAVAVGLDLRGFRDLTLTACAARNAEWAASEARCGVHFRTWAGVCPFWPTFLPLKLGHLLLRYQHGLGANDGLVPLESAVWQRKFFQGAVPFDHFNEVGWWTPDRVFGGDFVALTFERRVREFYVALARELQDLQ